MTTQERDHAASDGDDNEFTSEEDDAFDSEWEGEEGLEADDAPHDGDVGDIGDAARERAPLLNALGEASASASEQIGTEAPDARAFFGNRGYNDSASFRARIPALVAVCAPLLLMAVYIVLSASLAMPHVVLVAPMNSTVVSGDRAWNHVKNISAMAHTFNSRENDRVREYILNEVAQLQFLAEGCGHPKAFLSLTTDSVNMSTADGRIFYQSNNVIVKVDPFMENSNHAKKALLLSAHFDTQVLAPGVVDNSISVAVALEVLRALIFSPTLSHPVIFNFNNGEELFLLGAGAFTLHPWFKLISGFINLDGTGSAPGTRSMLFRTNSLSLLKEFQKHAPNPHASVLFNDVVSKIPSDTDYRVYVGYGHLQGLDFAFYSYRYQYHSVDDSVEFSWPISAQHLGDNVLAAVIGICNSNVLDTIDLAPPIEKPISDFLPIPDFVFFDLFGFLSITSGRIYRLTILWVAGAGLVWATGKSLKEIAKHGLNRFANRFVRPTLEAYAMVIFTGVSALAGTFFLSWCKTWMNRGSSYGMPLVNIGWICVWVYACVGIIPKVWPPIAEAVWLRKSRGGASVGTGMRYGGELGSRRRRVGGRRTRRMVRDSMDVTGVPVVLGQLSAGPPLEKWLPYGLLAFWVTLLIPTFWASSRGWNGLYFVSHWSFYSLLAVGFTQLLSPLALKWWRQQQGQLEFDAIGAQTRRQVGWHAKVVRFYERQLWGVQLAIASFIPGLLTLDVAEQMSIALPACIPGIPEIAHDALFAIMFLLLFVNLLPAFQMAARKSFIPETFLIALFVPLYIYSSMIFPISRLHPQQYSFDHEWNVTSPVSAKISTVVVSFPYGVVTTVTDVKSAFQSFHDNIQCSYADNSKGAREYRCRYSSVEVPLVDSADPTSLLRISAMPPEEFGTSSDNATLWDIHGEFNGLEGSRVCTLTADHIEPKSDRHFSIYVDPLETLDWEVEGNNGQRINPWNPERLPTHAGLTDVVVLRRQFEEGGMRVPFLIRYEGRAEDGSGVIRNLTVSCHLLEQEHSGFWSHLQRELPAWLIPGKGRYGGVRILKELILS
ncbi:hypothetical protein BC830DRAFT_224025 [Chytriomyces sp. MP71]|nr:hypothetical protein BC830DRAFT_224025 [Chytriomyces sp. MP71]